MIENMHCQKGKKMVFTAQSCRNFHLKELICKHALNNDAVPINPFMNYGYFLYDMVSRDCVREADKELMKRCDELWVYGEISDGVISEIKAFKELNKPIKFFNASKNYDKIMEIGIEELEFEDNLREEFQKIQ